MSKQQIHCSTLGRVQLHVAMTTTGSQRVNTQCPYLEQWWVKREQLWAVCGEIELLPVLIRVGVGDSLHISDGTLHWFAYE